MTNSCVSLTNNHKDHDDKNDSEQADSLSLGERNYSRLVGPNGPLVCRLFPTSFLPQFFFSSRFTRLGMHGSILVYTS